MAKRALPIDLAALILFFKFRMFDRVVRKNAHRSKMRIRISALYALVPAEPEYVNFFECKSKYISAIHPDYIVMTAPHTHLEDTGKSLPRYR